LSLLTSETLETKKRKTGTINSACEKVRAGYCPKSDLTVAEKSYILEHFPDAAIVNIASAGLHGGRHYSIYDLLGHSVASMVYVVTNLAQFNKFISLELERDFRKKNPEADSRIRSSFTSFMHENKLHWSMCCRKRNAGHDLPASYPSQKEQVSSGTSSSADLPHPKSRRGFLTEKQFYVLDLLSRGYSQIEIADMLGMSKASVPKLERKARGQVERARQTIKTQELAQRRQYKITIEPDTRLQKIPMIVVQEADRYGIHLEPSMAEILKMVKTSRQDCLTDGMSTKEINFSFNEKGKLSLL
jgi:hypothetical protein